MGITRIWCRGDRSRRRQRREEKDNAETQRARSFAEERDSPQRTRRTRSSEEKKNERTKGAAIRGALLFEDAYLPFFLVGFAVFFVAFFAMPGSCTFSQATTLTQSPLRLFVYGW